MALDNLHNPYKGYENPVIVRKTHYEKDESEVIIVIEQEHRTSGYAHKIIVNKKLELENLINQLIDLL